MAVLSLSGLLPLFAAGLLFAAVREALWLFSAVAVASALVALAAAFSISRVYVRGLGELDRAAKSFAARSFRSRAAVAGGGEIADLASAFNEMAERLESRAARFDELDRVKSEFVSSVSHELRTPLTTIKALTRLLKRGELPEEKRREYLDTISVECDRQIDLVLNLLDLSRIEGGVFRINPERVDVSAVLESCIRSEAAAAEKRGHRLGIERAGHTRDALADSVALRRVLSNIVENAIKYTPDGGIITLASVDEGDQIAIRVTDNGIGIPAEELPILFDKFHRGRCAPGWSGSGAAATDEDMLDDAEISGVGLGLYLARNIMTRMGGSIDVETAVGEGSTFTLRVPAWESEGGKSETEG